MNCKCETLNITQGTDVSLLLRLLVGYKDESQTGEPFPIELAEDVAVQMVSERGERVAVDFTVGDAGRVLLRLKGSDFRVGVYGVDVTCRLNGAAHRAYGDSVIRYTFATVKGAESVTVGADPYDVTLYVGYVTDIVPKRTSELVNDGEDGEHPFASEKDVEELGNAVTALDKKFGNYIPTAQKGAAGGVATLNDKKKVWNDQLNFAWRGRFEDDLNALDTQEGIWGIVGRRLGADILNNEEANGVLVQYADNYKTQQLMVGCPAGNAYGEQVETYTRRYLSGAKRWTEWYKNGGNGNLTVVKVWPRGGGDSTYAGIKDRFVTTEGGSTIVIPKPGIIYQLQAHQAYNSQPGDLFMFDVVKDNYRSLVPADQYGADFVDYDGLNSSILYHTSNLVDGGAYNSETKKIELKHGDTVVSEIDAAQFIVDGMVEDVRIENGNLVIDFNTASGKQDIAIPLTDIFDPNNYYDKTEADEKFQPKGNYLTEHQDISGKQDKLIAGNGIEIGQDGKTISATVSELITPITWAELKTLRDEKKLVAGMQYRITDFVTTVAQQDCQSAGHQFDIIVTADDEQTLNENARAALHDGDTYFANSNLAAWELKYTLDNDTEKYAWADAQNGKGVIYWMKDEKENEYPYDFKNVQFKRWAVTDVTSTKLTAEALDLLRQIYIYNEQTQPNRFAYKSVNIVVNGTTLVVDANSSDYYYTFSNDGADASINSKSVKRNVMGSYRVSNKFSLPNNVFFVDDCHSNVFGNNCYSNTFGNDCSSNTFGNGCRYNVFGNSCSSNVFGNNYGYNTFGNDCSSNTFGNDYGSNVFGNDCSSNTFGNGCSSNVFGNGCYSNTFGNSCYSNTFGNSCSSNVFENDCSKIASQKDFVCYVKMGSGVQYVDITTEQTTSSSQYLQNIEVRGVSGTSNSRKVINHPTVGDAFVTTYQPAGSQTISV